VSDRIAEFSDELEGMKGDLDEEMLRATQEDDIEAERRARIRVDQVRCSTRTL
jgi:hypothetical protein